MSILTIIAILCGAFAIIRSALEAQRLRQLLAPGRFNTVWRFLQTLMVIFAIGYLATAVLISAGLERGILVHLVGAIFLGGALFVYAVTRLASKMVQSVMNTAADATPSAHPRRVLPVEHSGTFRLNRHSDPKIEIGAQAGARLLVVDDSVINREILVRHLQNQGHDVVAAVDGASALAVLQGPQDIDLAILDYWLPDMDGLTILQAMQGDPRHRDTPVLMLSGEPDPTTIADCIAAGADDFLRKPFVPSLLRARIESCLAKRRFRERERGFVKRLERERERSRELLRVILPEPIAHELSQTNQVAPKRHEHVAVLFADISGFTAYCDKRQPEEVLSRLQSIVVAFEELAEKFGVQKIKTVGDSFMAACGLLDKVDDPVLRCVQMGLQMVEIVRRIEPEWQLRVGVHVGPVVAGIVGRSQYLFDIWGDTVNTASRVESCGGNGQVCVSRAAWREIEGRVRGRSLGLVEAKGKGEIELFRVDGTRPHLAHLELAGVPRRSLRSAA